MTDVQPGPRRPKPVERFKPTSGFVFGYAGLGLVVFTLAYVAWTVPTATGIKVALGAVFFGLVVWVTQIRPRATVYPRHVVLKNAVRDAHVPLAAVDEVEMGTTLKLRVGEQVYHCIGIGYPLREDMRARRRASIDAAQLGTSRYGELVQKANRANLDERAMTYQTFVLTRLDELVEQARKETGPSDVAEPRWVLAWPEVVGLAVTGLAFAVSLFL